MSATERVSIGSYLIGVFTGTLIQLALRVIDAVGGGNPDAGFLLVAFPIALPFSWLLNCAIGLFPFVILRDVSPNKAFVIVILAPIVSFLCLTGQLWIASLNPPPASRMGKVISEYWLLILAITFIGGAASWLFDQMRRRYFLAVYLSALVLCIVLPLTCFPFFVEFRAEKIAGERPYCILVPNKKYGGYDTATQTWQLSVSHMLANYTLTDGSRGRYFITNHAVLVIDSPQEYLNWSYHAGKFVHDPLVNVLQSCIPKPHFIATLN